VSSAPRPLGFLHATVLPGGYGLDMIGWRALVARRYGGHPEERIRALYEELAESTRDSGRDRLHALAIRPEDVRELLEPLDETERTPIPKVRPPTIRPPSKPPTNRIPMPISAGPKARPSRPSQPALSMSVRVVNLPEPEPPPPHIDDLPEEQELATDITQPMDAPSGTAAPLSGEHPKQVRPAAKAQRTWWVAIAALGVLVLLLGAVGWLAHRHRLLVDKLDQMAEELRKRNPDQEAWDRERKRLEDELVQARANTDQMCRQQVLVEVDKCNKSREQGRQQLDESERTVDDLRGKLTTLAKTREEAEARARAAAEDLKSQRAAAELQNNQLRASFNQRDELLKALCKSLQSGRKPHPKECLGI
jgi:hypothetical protein